MSRILINTIIRNINAGFRTSTTSMGLPRLQKDSVWPMSFSS